MSCNCEDILNEKLCDVPYEWRVQIIKAVCKAQEYEYDCEKSCQTITFLSHFRNERNQVCISYIDENKVTVDRCFDYDLTATILNDLILPDCVPLPPGVKFQTLNFDEKFQHIINILCESCCGIPITTTTTTTCGGINSIIGGTGFTTTTSTSTSSTTSTTTSRTILPSIQSPATKSICLLCSSSNNSTALEVCNFARVVPEECGLVYYSCDTLDVGCQLYTNETLTNKLITTNSSRCSFMGVDYYEVSTAGIITSVSTCPTPPPVINHCGAGGTFINPKIDGTSFNVGLATATVSFVGDVSLYGGSWDVPGTNDVFPPNSIHMGVNSQSATLTFNFSIPVNNIKLYITAMDFSESYTINTSSGIPTLNTIFKYDPWTNVTGNVISCSPISSRGSGSALVTVSSSTPFTTLTINRPADSRSTRGALVSICA